MQTQHTNFHIVKAYLYYVEDIVGKQIHVLVRHELKYLQKQSG